MDEDNRSVTKSTMSKKEVKDQCDESEMVKDNLKAGSNEKTAKNFNQNPDNNNDKSNLENKNLHMNSQFEAPKLSQNAQKLKDLEEKMTGIEDVLTEMKRNLNQNKEKRIESKEEITNIYHATKEIHDDFNSKLSERVKKSFVKDFDLASKLVVDHETVRKEKEAQNYELDNLIRELDHNNYQLVLQNRKLEEQNVDLKNEYDYLKEGYDELAKENSELRKENTKREEKIKNLENELSDMKNVISKLTEIRVILNKYFSSHFENFTPNERKLILELEGERNNSTNINPDMRENLYKSTNNLPPSSVDKNYSTNHFNSSKVNMHQPAKLDNTPTAKRILNEEEYRMYNANQKRLKGDQTNPNIISTQSKNKVSKEDPYSNPDDAFWYQMNKKK